MNKILTVSCIGMGMRGYSYTSLMLKHPDKYKLVSLCDINLDRLNVCIDELKVDRKQCFTSEEEFFKEKRSDLLIIATQDQDHVRQAIKALELGYDLLLEKPISNRESEIRELMKAKRKYNRKIFICHVLRYSPAFNKLHEIVASGKIGKPVLITGFEQVFFEHQAHSFVRGNWRNKELSSPMCLQKTCHDYDILVWLANSEADFVTSVGNLSFFKKENQPAGAADRCLECKYKESCIWSAYKIYIEHKFWGRTVVTDKRPVTDEDVLEGLKNGQYGKCVFNTDNNVVDNQFTTITFKNGCKATLAMTAFTKSIGRLYRVCGTKGEVDLDEENGYLLYKPFDGETEKYSISSLCNAADGHGGGDNGIVDNLYNNIMGLSSTATTSVDESIESHLIAFAAETSRLKNGKKVAVKK